MYLIHVYMAEILPIRRKTLSNQSNQSNYKHHTTLQANFYNQYG